MFNNVKRLSDEQLTQVLQQARSGNNDILQAMGLYSPIPLMAEQLRRKNLREEASAQQQQAQGQQPSVADQLAGVGSLPVPGMMEEQNFANGGIVAFNKGGSSSGFDYTNPYVPADILRAVHGVESTFGTANTKHGHMVSPAGATGHFQFMPATAKEYGLSREDTYDFDKSKMAAAKFLARLHNQFGNWEDAVTAYNWGPGNMAAYKKTGKGVGGRDRPSESINYPLEVQKHLGPDATYINRRGVSSAGRNERFPVEAEQIAANANTGDNASGINANLTAGRKEALDKMEALRREREGLLEKPEAPDTEAERKKMLEERAAFRKPFEERMDAMLAGMKPDTEKMSSSNVNESLLKASLALMGGRGKGITGALADIGAAGGIGVDAYSRGRANIQNAQRDFDKAQMLGEQEKFKLAKGDYDAANDAATQSTRLYRTAMTEFNKGRDVIARDHATNLRSVDQDFDARWKMFYEDARLKRMEEKDARRYADQSALNERQTKAIEERNRRSALDAVSRAMKAAQSSDNIERFASEASQTPEYKRLREAKDRAGQERYVREFAQQKALESALASEGISLAEYQELRRGQAGLGSIPRSAPAQASPAQSPATFNMDASGRTTPAR